MSENKIGPISLKERIEVLDVLRGLAICGILLGNMQWFSGYGMMPPALAAQAPLADQVTHFLVHFFIEGKFYSIFSFLFGFGFALQIARAAERGDTNASLFKRRLFWLLVIGLLHAWLLWAGDIVSIYAVMGFILVLFRKAKTETLLKWAVILLIVPILWYILQWILFAAFVPPEKVAEITAGQANGWSSTVRHRFNRQLLADPHGVQQELCGRAVHGPDLPDAPAEDTGDVSAWFIRIPERVFPGPAC